MGTVTQQNAAMVEESTAAARSLGSEADELNGQVARFRIGGAARQVVPLAPRASVPVRAMAQPAAPPRAAIASRGNLAVAADLDDWSSF